MYNHDRPNSGSNHFGGYAPRGTQGGGLPAPVQPKQLPQDYVNEAEQVMRALMEGGSRITSSKLRGIFALLTDIYNEESLRTDTTLSSASQAKLLRLRIRAVYDAGREPTVKAFIEKAHLLEYMKDIGTDREKLIRLSHYMEALVAYHRYFGGKEN